ncbi:MAG: hypothetical protein RIT04_337 [Candidatus Parcubacteria bacterium]|jgi:hypothetical protein
MWRKLTSVQKIILSIAVVFLFIGALADYITFIPKLTSIFLAAIGSIAMFSFWVNTKDTKK